MASFGEAFKSARSAGKKTFKWQGKTYHTKTKEEMEKKSVPAPQSKPSSGKAKEDEAPAKPAQSLKIGSRLRDERQDYPRPMRQVGIARKGSAISKAAARSENTPIEKKKTKPTPTGRSDRSY